MNGVRQQDRRASFSGCTRASPKLKETAWIIGELTDPIQLAQQCINSADQVDEHCAASLRLNTARLWPPAGSTIRSCRDADWGHARQTADCLVEQDHHVLREASFSDMRRCLAVINLHLVKNGASGGICLAIRRASLFSVRLGIWKLRLPLASDSAATRQWRSPSWKRPCTQELQSEIRLRASVSNSMSPNGV
jgi:hypothetical protein